MKKFSYQIPERKVGEIFSYNGSMYKVMDGRGDLDGKASHLTYKSIGCTRRNPETGNIENLCAFADCCGRVNIRHHGYCTPIYRKDGRTVYFAKIS